MCTYVYVHSIEKTAVGDMIDEILHWWVMDMDECIRYSLLVTNYCVVEVLPSRPSPCLYVLAWLWTLSLARASSLPRSMRLMASAAFDRAMSNTSKSTGRSFSGSEWDRSQILSRLEALEKSIQAERTAALKVENESRRLAAVQKERVRREKKSSSSSPITSERQSPTLAESRRQYYSRREKERMSEWGTRSITSDVTELETPRFPRRTTDITRFIKQVGNSTLVGTSHHKKDNRRVRTDVTLAAESYLCATPSPLTVPLSATFGIKYDTLIQEAEQLHNSMAYHRMHKLREENMKRKTATTK